MPDWAQGMELGAIFILLYLGALGIPLGSATLYTVLAVAAGISGTPDVLSLYLVGAMAMILGGQTAHALGYWLGDPWVRRVGPRFGLTFERARIVRYLFTIYGGRIVFFARFMGWLRSPAAILSGAGGMPAWRYLQFNGAASLIWAGYAGALPYFIGDWMQAMSWGGRIALIVALVGAIGAIAVHVLRSRAEIMARAAAMFPEEPTVPEPRIPQQ